MKNLAIFGKMLSVYEEKAFTNHYIWGFIYKKTVYMAHTGADILPLICCQDMASRGAGYSVRYCPTVAQKLYMLPMATPLCSVEFFNAEVAHGEYNRGEIFEKLVTELYGQIWVKDTVPFWAGPDLTVGDTHYQIKFERATFCNEKTLANIPKNT